MAGQYQPISQAVHQDGPSCLHRPPAHCPITNLEVCIETPGSKISQPSTAQIVSPPPSLTLQGEDPGSQQAPLGTLGMGEPGFSPEQEMADRCPLQQPLHSQPICHTAADHITCLKPLIV